METENNKPEKVGKQGISNGSSNPTEPEENTLPKKAENDISPKLTENNNSTNQNKQSNQNKNLPISALAVSSLVVSAVGVFTSFIPFVNNVTPIFFVIGLGLWIPGFIQIQKGKRRSRPIAITAIILCACSLILCLACQAACSSILKDTTSSLKNEISNSTTNSNSSSSSSNKDAEKTEFKIGETATFKNGLKVTVVSVEGGFTNYDGTSMSKAVVKYENTGTDEVSFNTYDWKAEDAQGVQTSSGYYSKADNSLELNSGKLAAGGTKTGEMYFKGGISKMVYSSSVLSKSNVKWVVQ